MRQETELPVILSHDWELEQETDTADLLEMMEFGLHIYYDLSTNTKQKKICRDRVNQIVTEINTRKRMNLFSHL